MKVGKQRKKIVIKRMDKRRIKMMKGGRPFLKMMKSEYRKSWSVKLINSKAILIRNIIGLCMNTLIS